MAFLSQLLRQKNQMLSECILIKHSVSQASQSQHFLKISYQSHFKIHLISSKITFKSKRKVYNKSIVQYLMLGEVNQTQQTIIDVVGWIYFFAWSLSFYGQIYTNYKVKNVEGMNFDFVAMNLTGFLFYSIYNTYGYFIDDSQTGKVDLNDIFFAYHAMFATILTITQICIYPKKDNRVHSYTVVLLVLMWVFAGVYTTLILGTKTITVEPSLGEISFLGYFKLAISSLKYLPQLYWNYQRKSTAGWSIFNILMDLTGGLFSFGQMGLEAIFGMDVKINIVKLVLGIMVVFYDILFVIQHYCLYPQKKRKQVSEYSKFVDQSIPKVNKQSIESQA